MYGTDVIVAPVGAKRVGVALGAARARVPLAPGRVESVPRQPVSLPLPGLALVPLIVAPVGANRG